jgi:hypothetical protein
MQENMQTLTGNSLWHTLIDTHMLAPIVDAVLEAWSDACCNAHWGAAELCAAVLCWMLRDMLDIH